MVASGDMSGLIKVWKVETKEEIWSFEVGDLEVRASDPKKHCISLFSLCICKHLCEVFYGACRNLRGDDRSG